MSIDKWGKNNQQDGTTDSAERQDNSQLKSKTISDEYENNKNDQVYDKNKAKGTGWDINDQYLEETNIGDTANIQPLLGDFTKWENNEDEWDSFAQNPDIQHLIDIILYLDSEIDADSIKVDIQEKACKLINYIKNKFNEAQKRVNKDHKNNKKEFIISDIRVTYSKQYDT